MGKPTYGCLTAVIIIIIIITTTTEYSQLDGTLFFLLLPDKTPSSPVCRSLSNKEYPIPFAYEARTSSSECDASVYAIGNWSIMTRIQSRKNYQDNMISKVKYLLYRVQRNLKFPLRIKISDLKLSVRPFGHHPCYRLRSYEFTAKTERTCSFHARFKDMAEIGIDLLYPGNQHIKSHGLTVTKKYVLII
ncbi:hypothetical protein BDV35DRAFT_145121 [Aspergillus flavus]|uniref:Uncharacterized protein n=1 Tax=Aspergillus flavus TaxID=5059 RepID=A0A5N6GCD8_ASPFL|nr:hypothetical protein BDV35DRAFT_145121 [Aspergillus flavus]